MICWSGDCPEHGIVAGQDADPVDCEGQLKNDDPPRRQANGRSSDHLKERWLMPSIMPCADPDKGADE
jgi:hypothetical protein